MQAPNRQFSAENTVTLRCVKLFLFAFNQLWKRQRSGAF